MSSLSPTPARMQSLMGSPDYDDDFDFDFDLDSADPSFSCLSPLPENPMPLPPKRTYNSEQAMVDSIQAFASEHHYAFRIGRSMWKGKKKVVFYECDRARKPPPKGYLEHSAHMRVRNTTTRKTNCQFSVKGVQINEDQWELRHRPDDHCAVHNHAPSHAATSHPVHRRFDPETKEKVRELHNAGKSMFTGS
jgi:hypothetical protein